jgi:hypothetical protein
VSTLESTQLEGFHAPLVEFVPEREIPHPQAFNGSTTVNVLPMCTEEKKYLFVEIGPRDVDDLWFDVTTKHNSIKDVPIAYCTLEQFRVSPSVWSYSMMRPAYRREIKRLELKANCMETLRVIARIKNKRDRPKVQTESMVGEQKSGYVDEGVINDHENLVDTSGGGVDTFGAGKSFVFNQGQSNLLGLADFFRRPVEIDSFNIAVGSALSISYPIWDLYTLNPAVRSKLRNYAYLHGNLHVVVAVSGSPFHYGRLLLSYQPYPQRNLNIVSHEAAIAVDTLHRPLFLNYLSQARGATTLDVKNNRPVEMVCPFISTKPMHRLFNSDPLALDGLSSYHDLEEAGSLYIYSLNAIGAVATGASPVSVQVYAFMTDVELGCPTATLVGVVTEADEIDMGPVEKFTSGAADIANALGNLPTIGPVAKASGMVFSGLSSLCAYFGWSRPVIVEPAIFVKNRPFCNGSQLVGSETVSKISLYQKQEITVDPRSCGSEEDEMTLKFLCGIESYIETFQWSPTDILMADSIWKCRVNPALDTIYRDAAKDYYQPSALSFASSPFKFWRGDITFRFEIVCSAYHRGKLAFYYEPNIAQYVLIDADISTNKNFLHILDIQETQCIEFCIGWASPRAWNLCVGNGVSILNTTEFSSSSSSYEYVNGYIGVVPFTDLQSPDDSTIEINVYVRSDDMHFNLFSAQNLPTERLVKTESEEVKYFDEVSCFQLNETTASDTNISVFHFGEEPLSFRSLLKRYTQTYEETLSGGASTDVSIKAVRLILPLASPAYDESGVTDSSLIQYLPYAYMGMRGSIRKRMRLKTEKGQLGEFDRVTVSLVNLSSSVAETLAWDTQVSRTFQRGSVSFYPDTNAGVEVEFPFYSSNLFVFSFCDDYVGAGNNDNDMSETWTKRFIAYFDSNNYTSTKNFFQEDTATGEDFTFMRYCGAPFYSKDPVV